MRGLAGTDDRGVSVRAAPELSPATRAGGTFSIPSCSGAASFAACERGSGAEEVGMDGCAEAGRGGLPLTMGRACWLSERAILLIRTFLAMAECWLKRRGGEVESDVDEDVFVE